MRIGDIFGSRTVISEPFLKKVGKKRLVRHVKTQCTCGYIGDVQVSQLKSGTSRSCYKCSTNIVAVSIGDEFGKWVVIEAPYVKTEPRERVYVKCRCQGCGYEKDVCVTSLLRGKSKKCRQCANAQHLKKGIGRKGTLAREGKKVCASCQRELRVDEFSKAKKTRDGLSPSCKLCYFYFRIKAEYGLSKSEYESLYEASNGLCAICGESFGDSRPDIDHCHLTKEIRGLTHRNCNTAFGLLKESPSVFRSALKYAEKWWKTKDENTKEGFTKQ